MSQQFNESQVKNLITDLAAKAPLVSPALTGTPTAPTPATTDNSTQIATTAFVKAQGASTPIATATTVGTVKPGTGLTVATDGTLSLTAGQGLYTGNYALGGSGPTTATFNSSVTAGNAILVLMDNASGVTIGDNHGDTFNPIAGPQGFFNLRAYLALNVAGGVTTINTSGGFAFAAFELNNIVSASALDGTPGFAGGGAPITLTASTTTSNATDYLVAVGLIGSGSGFTATWSSGFTARGSVSANGDNWYIADKNVTAAGAQSVTWSNSSSSNQTALYLIALKSTGPSGAGVTSVNSATGAVTIAPGTGVSVSTSGSTVTVAVTGSGSGPTLETNGTTNGSQSVLNLVAGSNVTLTDNGAGAVTIASTGGSGGGGGGGALTLISSQVLTSSAASVTFPSIAGSYRNLVLVYSGRTDTSGSTNVYLQFNGDTAANYDTRFFYNNATGTMASETYYGLAKATYGSVASSAAPTGQAGGGSITIYNYAGTTFWKELVGHCTRKDSASAGYIISTGGEWKNTAAITSIVVGLASAGNFTAGSVFALYGTDAGGGGSSVSIGTRASLPASAGLAGTTYDCSDSPYRYVSDGTKWNAFVYGVPVTEPTTAVLSQVYGTTNAPDTSRGGLNIPMPTANDSMYGVAKPSASSWSAVAGFIPRMTQGQFSQCSLILYDAGSTKATMISWLNPWNAGKTYEVTKWSNATTATFSASYTIPNAGGSSTIQGYGDNYRGMAGLLWLRVKVTSTNISYYLCHDPWTTDASELILTTTLTDWLPAITHVGVRCAFNVGTMWLQHFLAT